LYAKPPAVSLALVRRICMTHWPVILFLTILFPSQADNASEDVSRYLSQDEETFKLPKKTFTPIRKRLPHSAELPMYKLNAVDSDVPVNMGRNVFESVQLGLNRAKYRL